MQRMNMQRVAWGLGALLSACSGEAGLGTDELSAGQTREEIIRASQTGGRNEVVMIYATTINPSTGNLRHRQAVTAFAMTNRQPLPKRIRWRLF